MKTKIFFSLEKKPKKRGKKERFEKKPKIFEKKRIDSKEKGEILKKKEP
jgi:hypothetical protein